MALLISLFALAVVGGGVYLYATDRRKKEVAYNRDMNEVYELIRDISKRLKVLEVFVGDGPRIAAAMDSDDDLEYCDWGIDV